MKAYLVHLFLGCGGGERVSFEIASTLRNKGFSVIYVTNNRAGLQKCAEHFRLPDDYEIVEVSSLLEKMISLTGRFVRYRWLLIISAAYKEILGFREKGLTIETSINYPVSVDISYIHYPLMLYPNILGTTKPKSSSLHWRLYNWFVTRKARSMMGEPRLLLTNTTWTAKLIKEVYGFDAYVLYPPVDVEYFTYDGRPKEKIVVTTSRLVQSKNLHLLPRVASKIPDYEWYLFGNTGMISLKKSSDMLLIKSLLAEKEKWGAENFHVCMDEPREKLRDLLLRATFYIHPPFAEPFGIAIVEAMSASAIPIVYRDGGGWTDVVSKLDPRLGYTNINEIPSIIKLLEKTPDLDNLREKSIEHAKSFSASLFRKRFAEILDEYIRKLKH